MLGSARGQRLNIAANALFDSMEQLARQEGFPLDLTGPRATFNASRISKDSDVSTLAILEGISIYFTAKAAQQDQVEAPARRTSRATAPTT
jgi:hypothetical protein